MDEELQDIILGALEKHNDKIKNLSKYYVSGDDIASKIEQLSTAFDTKLTLVKTSLSDGEDGSNGSDGEDGSNGSDGVNGVDGIDGHDGLDGHNGEDGTNGSDGSNGSDGIGVKGIRTSKNKLLFDMSDKTTIAVKLDWVSDRPMSTAVIPQEQPKIHSIKSLYDTDISKAKDGDYLVMSNGKWVAKRVQTTGGTNNYTRNLEELYDPEYPSYYKEFVYLDDGKASKITVYDSTKSIKLFTKNIRYNDVNGKPVPISILIVDMVTGASILSEYDYSDKGVVQSETVTYQH